MSSMPSALPRIGISACLLGQPVRYNGGHKLSRLCSEALAPHFQLIPCCPEVGVGLGTPREPIRLVGDPAQPRVVGTRDPELDVTDRLHAYGQRMAREMADLDGFIFMQKSPSCGLERVKVYRDNGHPFDQGSRGAFAHAFCEQRPDLPTEEDGRLNDPVLRENFISRVYIHREWRQLLADGPVTRHDLLSFHARHKYQLMAHNPQAYQQLGHWLGQLGRFDADEVPPRYFSRLMQALRRCATRGSHSNVLGHLSGYLRQDLCAADRQELARLIDQYRRGVIPLVVPMMLLKHHLQHHPDDYVARQSYLQPHPETLSLRNAI